MQRIQARGELAEVMRSDQAGRSDLDGCVRVLFVQHVLRVRLGIVLAACFQTSNLLSSKFQAFDHGCQVRTAVAQADRQFPLNVAKHVGRDGLEVSLCHHRFDHALQRGGDGDMIVLLLRREIRDRPLKRFSMRRG